jgi:hypothetical protein
VLERTCVVHNTLPQSGVTVAHIEAHLEEVMDGFAKHIQVPSFRGFDMRNSVT